MQEEIDKSIKNFYRNNNIDSHQYVADELEAYKTNKEYNVQIAEEYLKEKVLRWIHKFNKPDRQYFLKLLEKYIYISEKEYRHRVYCLSNYIAQQVNAQKLKNEEILFVSVAAHEGLASGGDSLRNALIIANSQWGIDKHQIVSDVSKLSQDVLEKSKVVIFIDDIIGTGFSIAKTIDEFFVHFPDIDKEKYFWGIAGILITRSSIRLVKNKMLEYGVAYNIYAKNENYIKSCFKGNYIFDEKEVKRIEKIVKEYEEKIGIDRQTNKNFVMGFRACKLLLSFYYNTPNNTLCNFWKLSEDNFPVFPRDEYIRPTIQSIRDNKQHYQKNAYLKGCEEKK